MCLFASEYKKGQQGREEDQGGGGEEKTHRNPLCPQGKKSIAYAKHGFLEKQTSLEDEAPGSRRTGEEKPRGVGCY